MINKKAVPLDPNDLTVLKQIQSAGSDLLKELGQIKLTELSIEKRIENAKNYQEQLKSKESLIGKQLQEKYGRGTVDLETGTFIPA
jgi:hypothetical protein|tara:strand:+ start:639 stop:896 length:258 start_codon:yes stop_codon:yes gene_type:complete